MSISPGTKLGPYEILAPLGKGGMGEVWKARDTRLGRDVALKILPVAFASDPDRMARFEREARVLALLDHPNIAAIYGLEENDGIRALVLALVDGPTLADRISAGPIPLDEAIQIARQIADAVEYAHERGVIHRDLKPANIKITSGGMVKVLDFGLAKALDDESVAAASTNSPTLTMNATRAGVLLGTAAYMSPEQAKGKQADRRSDIWSFGAVLYETVTGRPPFSGESVGEVIAAVIKDEPKLDAVPAQLRGLVARCLNKDPRKRLQAIGEARIILEEPAPPVQIAVVPAQHKRPLAWIVAGVLGLAFATAMAGLWRTTRSVEPPIKPLVRLDVDLGPDVSLGSQVGADAILSPDGNRLVYVSQGKLFTRRLDQPKATELTGTDGAFSAFFSPDGQWVAFFSQNKLKKISVEGGTAIALCDATDSRGGSWAEDGNLIVALTGAAGLSRVPAAGGFPIPLTELASGEATHRWPHVLSGSKAVLFTAHRFTTGFEGGDIEIISLADHRIKTLVRGGMFGRYLPVSKKAGYLAYVSRGTLFAAAFDPDKLELRGTPSPVLEQVSYSSAFGSAQFDFSGSGTLLYREGLAEGDMFTIQWLTGDKMQPLLAKPGYYMRPNLSPDGQRLAMDIAEGSGSDIWVYDGQRETMTRLTFGGNTFYQPVWSPDGRYILGRANEGTFWINADGAGGPRPLTMSKNAQFIWSFSPDRKWLAYASNESGTSQIYVRAFPDKGSKWQISNTGGTIPKWSRNGRELFFRTLDGRIMVATYTAKGDSFVAGKPRVWAEKPLADFGPLVPNYDLAPDGKRIAALMPVQGTDAQQRSHVMFLENFLDELRRRVPVSK